MSNKHGKNRPPNQAVQTAARNATPTQVRVQQQTVVQRMLPEPEELQKYKELDPDLYNAIRDEFLANGAHRRRMESDDSERMTKIVRSASATEKYALYGTLTFAFCALAIGAIAMFTGHSVGALVAVLGVVPGILAVIRGTGRGKPE